MFQSLDAIAHVLVFPDIDQAWIVQNVYTLFASLRRNSSPSDSDMAGIHNANKNEEREALVRFCRPFLAELLPTHLRS